MICRRESRYGVCHRRRWHLGPHATTIGPDAQHGMFWFAWARRDIERCAYGWFVRLRFVPTDMATRW